MMADDLGGGKTVEGNLCGPHGTNSCLPEGDANDPIFSNRNVIEFIAPFALPGVGQGVGLALKGSRLAATLRVAGASVAMSRVARGVEAVDKADRAMGPAANGRLADNVRIGAFIVAVVGDAFKSIIRLREILHLPQQGGAGWPGFPR